MLIGVSAAVMHEHSLQAWFAPEAEPCCQSLDPLSLTFFFPFLSLPSAASLPFSPLWGSGEHRVSRRGLGRGVTAETEFAELETRKKLTLWQYLNSILRDETVVKSPVDVLKICPPACDFLLQFAYSPSWAMSRRSTLIPVAEVASLFHFKETIYADNHFRNLVSDNKRSAKVIRWLILDIDVVC